MMSKQNVSEALDCWLNAVSCGDPKAVLALYDSEAVLLPTLSGHVHRSHKEFETYFRRFLPLGPKGEVVESHVRILGDVAINSGTYTFTLASGDCVPARYTFVYHWKGDRWLIVEHHSSQMPEET